MSFLLRTSSLASLTLAASVLFAQGGFFSSGPQPLTQNIVDEAVKAIEVVIHGKFSPAQKAKMKDIMAAEWTKPGSNMAESTLGLIQAMPQLMALEPRVRDLALRANLLEYVQNLDRDARNGDPSSQVILEAYRANHPPIDPRAPLYSTLIADAYLDNFLFAGEIQSGKPLPKLTAEGRATGRKRLAADYVKMDQAAREKMSKIMAKVTQHRIAWPQLQLHERLMVKAELGGRLTAEEQAFVAQARQMVSQHNWQMIAGELNHMRANQQLIMGSAPYFNHSTQRWEQIGGIVTEFR